MSKLMGKLTFKRADFREKVLKKGLMIRFLKRKGLFEIRGLRVSKEEEEADLLESCGMRLKDIGEDYEKGRALVHEDILSAMIVSDHLDQVVCEFAIGYKTRRLVSDEKVLERKEMDFIRSCVGYEEFASFDSGLYKDICVWQELFNISDTMLKRAKRKRGHDFVIIGERRNNKGRSLGAKNLNKSGVLWTEEDQERVEHNKRVAVEKGYAEWYLDACYEECKGKGIAFVREKYLKEFQECRKMMLKE